MLPETKGYCEHSEVIYRHIWGIASGKKRPRNNKNLIKMCPPITLLR